MSELMRNLALISAISLSLAGTIAVASDAVPQAFLGSKGSDTSADTGSDTGNTTDTGDTSDTGDSGDTGDTGDTDDTGSDTGTDTGTDTGVDTGPTGYSAAELAGDPGGFGCATLTGRASGMLVFGSVLLLLWRRKDD